MRGADAEHAIAPAATSTETVAPMSFRIETSSLATQGTADAKRSLVTVGSASMVFTSPGGGFPSTNVLAGRRTPSMKQCALSAEPVLGALRRPSAGRG